MKVSVNGLGNIGTTLALILQTNKDLLGITEVFGFKNTKMPWQKNDLVFLEKAGIRIVSAEETTVAKHIKSIDFLFDTTSNGIGLKNKEEYYQKSHLKGVIAQGSENGFGVKFMSGLPINLNKQKYVQIVSCNTHAAAALLQLFSDQTLSNILSADFVVVRRSEDIGNHQRLVSANVVARHLSEEIGTHHGIDVKSMFEQLGVNCVITSSDITTPSQLMHAIRFHIHCKTNINWNNITEKISTNSAIAITQKFDSNVIFELGRRYGRFGRIYNHVIIVENNLLKTEDSVKGWAFVPQEGNTIISTIEAFLKMTNSDKANEIMLEIQKLLCIKVW